MSVKTKSTRSYIICHSLNMPPVNFLSHYTLVSPLPCTFSNTPAVLSVQHVGVCCFPSFEYSSSRYMISSKVRLLVESYRMTQFKTLVLFSLHSLSPSPAVFFSITLSIPDKIRILLMYLSVSPHHNVSYMMARIFVYFVHSCVSNT